MKKNKHNISHWNETKEKERFIVRMIILAIVTGLTGGIVLVIEIFKFYEAITDCMKS